MEIVPEDGSPTSPHLRRDSVEKEFIFWELYHEVVELVWHETNKFRFENGIQELEWDTSHSAVAYRYFKVATQNRSESPDGHVEYFCVGTEPSIILFWYEYDETVKGREISDRILQELYRGNSRLFTAPNFRNGALQIFNLKEMILAVLVFS